MFEQRQQRQRGRGQQAEARTEATDIGTNPAVVAAVASVFLSWYEFFVRDNRAMGLFVGLWAPTIFAFAGYFNQSRMAQYLRNLR